MMKRLLYAWTVMGLMAIGCGPGNYPTQEDPEENVDAFVVDQSPSLDMGVDTTAPVELPPDLGAPDSGHSEPAPDLGVPNPGDIPPPPLPVDVNISSPKRGVMYKSSASSINVSGKITGAMDNFDKLLVNGQEVVVSDTGHFSLPLKSKWGLNVVTLDCYSKSGEVSNHARSYLYADKYRSMSATAGVDLTMNDALVARLDQGVVDDGNRYSVDDLATILQKVINKLDLSKALPKTLAQGQWALTKYDLKTNGPITTAPIKVTLNSQSGGLHINLTTASLDLPIEFFKPFQNSGVVSATDVAIEGDIKISKTSTGSLKVSVPSLTVTYKKMKVDLGKKVLDIFQEGLVNFLLPFLKGTIKNGISEALKLALPGPAKQFVNQFKLNTTFKLPSLLGGATMNVYSTLSEVSFSGLGGTITLKAAVHGSKNLSSGGYGVIRTDGQLAKPGYAARPLRIGVRRDSLNQMLYSAWYAGAFKQDISSALSSNLGNLPLPYTAEKLELEIDAKLPPVLMPEANGHDHRLAIGDLFVKATLTTDVTTGASIVIEGYLSAILGASVSVNSKGKLVLGLSQTADRFELDLTKFAMQGISAPAPSTLAGGIEVMLLDLLPQLIPPVIQKFPLPTIDLSQLDGADNILPDKTLKLSAVTVTHRTDYVVLTGDIK